MKTRIVFFMGFIGCLVHADYYPVEHYGEAIYKLLDAYCKQNTSVCARDVQNYLNSDALGSVMNESKSKGYEYMELLRAAYHYAITQSPQNEKIEEALCNQLNFENTFRTVVFWSCFGFTIVGTVVLIPVAFMSGCMYYNFIRS